MTVILATPKAVAGGFQALVQPGQSNKTLSQRIKMVEDVAQRQSTCLTCWALLLWELWESCLLQISRSLRKHMQVDNFPKFIP